MPDQPSETEVQRHSPFGELAGAFGPVRRWLEDSLGDPVRGLEVLGPVVDITESDDQYVISAEVPGVDKADLTLEIHEGVLTLRGEKKEEREEGKDKARRLERRYGAFSRSFSLPSDADPERVEARFRDGVLRIAIAKRPEAKPAQVAVK